MICLSLVAVSKARADPMNVLKKAILAATMLGALVGYTSTVRAGPLHGFCSGCTEQTIGGNDVTLLGPNGVTGFGFNSSPANSGNLQLKFLIPDNFTLAQVQAFAVGVSVTGTSSSGLSLFSTTPWTSGFLERLSRKYAGQRSS